MQDLDELTKNDGIDNNDDMIATDNDTDTSISFKTTQSAIPKRGWTKKQIQSVWIIGVIITILIAIGSFLLKDVNLFGIFA